TPSVRFAPPSAETTPVGSSAGAPPRTATKRTVLPSLSPSGRHGLLAYIVGQRSREIGIRMALGARREDILRMFLHRGVALASVGVVVGLVISASTASVMASLLYGVRPR